MKVLFFLNRYPVFADSAMVVYRKYLFTLMSILHPTQYKT